jgi:hypothetical protein
MNQYTKPTIRADTAMNANASFMKFFMVKCGNSKDLRGENTKSN